jgi:hypothetical protein
VAVQVDRVVDPTDSNRVRFSLCPGSTWPRRSAEHYPGPQHEMQLLTGAE